MMLRKAPEAAAGAAVLLASLLLALPARAEESPTIVVFGAGGDLAGRKLMPAFLELQQQGLLPDKARLVGFDRAAMSTGEFRKQVANRTKELAPKQWKGGSFGELSRRISYVGGDLTDPGSMKKLAKELDRIDKKRGSRGPRIFYLALPPGVVPTALDQLKASHLIDSRGPPSRVIVEKPFGTDLASAKKLHKRASGAAGEGVYRIDHYLGKVGVRNFLALRLGGKLEKAWNRRYIERVEVRARESLGIEGRASFYEQTGALKDMVQSHLLEVASLALMEPPGEKSDRALRQARIKALDSLARLSGSKVDKHVLRAQYGAGEGGPGYLQEAGNSSSRTETYVALETRVGRGRLRGVPLFVETGKALDGKKGEVVVKFRRLPREVARELGVSAEGPATLTVSIDPEPSMRLRSGGREVKIDPPASTGPELEPYSRLIHEAIQGEKKMFVHPGEVEASWRFLEPILKRWERSKAKLPKYARGSAGPRTDALGTQRRASQEKRAAQRQRALKRRQVRRGFHRRGLGQERTSRERARRQRSPRSHKARGGPKVRHRGASGRGRARGR